MWWLFRHTRTRTLAQLLYASWREKNLFIPLSQSCVLFSDGTKVMVHELVSCLCSMGSDNTSVWTEDVLHASASGWGVLSLLEFSLEIWISFVSHSLEKDWRWTHTHTHHTSMFTFERKLILYPLARWFQCFYRSGTVPTNVMEGVRMLHPPDHRRHDSLSSRKPQGFMFCLHSL